MKKYTTKDLKGVTKGEIVDILRREGVEFDETQPFFALRALCLNIEDNEKNDEIMGKKNTNPVENNGIENEQMNGVETPVEQPVENGNEENDEQPEPKNSIIETQPRVTKSAMFSELAKRKRGFAVGKSAFASELAKRKGERVSGVTFAQELKNRKTKFNK